MTEKKSRGMRRGSMDLSGFLERKPAKNFCIGRQGAVPVLLQHTFYEGNITLFSQKMSESIQNHHTLKNVYKDFKFLSLLAQFRS